MDSTWRVWRRHAATDRNGKSVVDYNCIHTGTFRSFPVLDLTFTGDYSVMVLGHPTCVSLWRSKQATTFSDECLISVLPLPTESVTAVMSMQLQWIESSYWSDDKVMMGESLLFVCTGRRLYLWDVQLASKPSIVWFHKLEGGKRLTATAFGCANSRDRQGCLLCIWRNLVPHLPLHHLLISFQRPRESYSHIRGRYRFASLHIHIQARLRFTKSREIRRDFWRVCRYKPAKLHLYLLGRGCRVACWVAVLLGL